MSFRLVNWGETLRENARRLQELTAQRYRPERDREFISTVLSSSLILRKCNDHGMLPKDYLSRAVKVRRFPRRHEPEIDALPTKWQVDLFDFEDARDEQITIGYILNWLIHDKYLLLYDPEDMPRADETGFAEYGIEGFAFASDFSVKDGLREMSIKIFCKIVEEGARELGAIG